MLKYVKKIFVSLFFGLAFYFVNSLYLISYMIISNVFLKKYIKNKYGATMIKKIFIMIIILFSYNTTNAEEYYYYGNGNKIYLSKSEKFISVQFDSNNLLEIEGAANLAGFQLKQNIKPEKNIMLLEHNSMNNINTSLNYLREEIEVIRSFPSFYSINRVSGHVDTSYLFLTDEFILKFVDNLSTSKIDSINSLFGVEILGFNEYNEYHLRINDTSLYSTLEIANIYYENNLTEWSHPNFFTEIRFDNIADPLFTNQWHLQNTGQAGGTAGVDINVVPAWNITTGDSNIVVSVLDDGVEMHEDFYSGQLVPGFTIGGGNGSPCYIPLIYEDECNDWHGQHVAGIIAANHNDNGVRGVSPKSKIMSIRILIFEPTKRGDITKINLISAAIDTAWSRGSHILNNSWGVNFRGAYFDNIAAAITRALTLGRGGKGCLVVKSAGNTARWDSSDSGFVTFPGTVPGVFVVGAVANQNFPTNYTPRSPRVDVVAPSDGGTLDIATLDRMGIPGSIEGNYYNNFGGTSAAAPQVAGIGALMLSVNPNLEARSVGPNPNPQVQNIIKFTSDDYGNTNWDGYGRVNAYKALRCSQPILATTLKVRKVSINGIFYPRLYWTSIDTLLKSYRIYRKLFDEQNFLLIATVGKDTAFFVDQEVIIMFSRHGPAGTDTAKYYITADYGIETFPSNTVSVQYHGLYRQEGELKITALDSTKPKFYSLETNYPNPFNPSTIIKYNIPDVCYVTLKVYNTLGKEVATLVNEIQDAGFKEINFDASANGGLPSGVYFYRLYAGNFVSTNKMLLIR